MKKLRFTMGTLVLLAAANTAVQAQTGSLGPPGPAPVLVPCNLPPPSGPSVPVAIQPLDYYSVPPGNVPVVVEEPPRRAWVTLDYLLWWVKPGPAPGPLATLGSTNDIIAGALGQPNTQVLFGEHNVDFGALSGFRFDAGWWLPSLPMLGFEAGFFVLQAGSVKYRAFSDPNGSPIVARPIINALDGTESAYIDSHPGIASGGVTARFTSQLDSWEFNTALNLVDYPNFRWDMLAGFRAVDLVEDLRIRDFLLPLVAGSFGFQGIAADPPSALVDFDHFRTTNHFYGGQIGSRFDWNFGRLDVKLTTKVALGTTQQSITVDGGSMLLTPGLQTLNAPGGILALPTNMGRARRNIFTVVPEAGLNTSYQLTPWCGVQFGYTFLYWSNVVRPGNQIDRTVNPTQVPTDSGYGTLTGPARPALVPQTGDFWTQGLNLGVVFRF